MPAAFDVAGIHISVRAGGQPVQILAQHRIVRAAFSERKIRCDPAVEPPEFFDGFGRKSTQAAPLDRIEQILETLPAWSTPLDEHGLSHAGVFAFTRETAYVERTVTVRTPESIAFTYELAGLGSRFLAVALDFVIQAIVSIGIFFLLVFAAERSAEVGTALRLNGNQVASLFLAIAIFLNFIVFVGYFIVFEAAWNGQTPGKRLLGIRVVRDGGYPIDVGGAVLRNLVRVAEAIFFYIPAAVSALLSSQNKRLGDFVAGTIVVRDRAFEVTNPRAWLQGDQSPDLAPLVAQESLTSDEWTLIERYVERRTTLPPSIVAATAERIAASLRSKIGAAAAGLTDDDLLLRLYASRRR